MKNKKFFSIILSVVCIIVACLTFCVGYFTKSGELQNEELENLPQASTGAETADASQKGKLNLKWLFYVFYPDI